MERLGIKPLKPDLGFKGYAGLLSEGQVALIMNERPLDFDLDNYNAFCTKFKSQIDERYGDEYLPMFYVDNVKLSSDSRTG